MIDENAMLIYFKLKIVCKGILMYEEDRVNKRKLMIW